MSASKNLGKVFMTPKGIWDKTLNYTKLDIVTNKVGKISCGYIATTDIEKNVEITDNRWLKLFELLDGDLTEEYKAVQTDVTNKATDVDTNKKAVDLIYSQMQKLYDVEISTTTPTNERTGLWINPDDISSVINIPEIKDDEVSDVDTWSSKKIDNVTGSLKEDISTKITKFYASSQGENHLADSDNGKIQDMMVYGKSEQKQYSGKNLLNYDAWKRVLITRGTAVFEKNSFTLTATENDCYTEPTLEQGFPDDAKIEISEGETVTLSWESSADTDGNIYIFPNGVVTDGLVYTNNHNTKTLTYTAARGVKFITFRFGVAHAGDTISYKNIQIEKGSESTTYEPYTGGIPSPNPDYPQEIKSVANPTVKVCGKNLFKATLGNVTANGITCTANSDGTYILNGTCTVSTALSKIGIFDHILNEPLYLTGVPSGCGSYLALGRRDGDNILVTDGKNTKIDAGIHTDHIEFWITKGTTLNNVIFKPMLTTDPTVTYDDFEPYHEQTVTLPYTLNAIPVESGGNVTIDGQQYIADYVDVERGKLVRMVYVLDASANADMFRNYWEGETDGKQYLIRTDFASPPFSIEENAQTWCNKYNLLSNNFEYTRFDGCLGKKSCVYIGNPRSIQIYLSLYNQKLSTIKEQREWLKNNQTYIYVPLNTPEEADLTTEEIAAFKALATYYPITNISINSEQLDGYAVFNYPISMENGWNYVKQQIGDTREYIYDMDARAQDTDLQAAEAYVNSEYAVALTELEV